MKQWIAFVTLGILGWGASFLFIKIGLTSFSPLMLVAIRLFIGSLALWLLLLSSATVLHRIHSQLGWFAVVGLINTAVPFLLISWGEIFVSSGLAGVLNGTTPIMTALVAHVALEDERLTLNKALGVGAGFTGVVILFLPQLEVTLEGHIGAKLAILTAATSYAIAGVITRRKLKNIEPIITATFSTTAAALFIGLAALVSPRSQVAFSPTFKGWLAVIWLGLIGTALAYRLYFLLVKEWGASRAATVHFVYPLAAVLLGTIILNEPLSMTLILGSILIITGVVLIVVKNQQTTQTLPLSRKPS
jgi:drug/metabolite transporter (DMT)-like permease